MTQSVVPVDYATPVVKRYGDNVHIAGVIAVALVAGFMGANAFAAAVGFDPINDARTEPGEVMVHIICGAVIALAAGTATVLLYRAFVHLRRYLATTAQRPSFAASTVMMSLGVFCMILPLVLPYLPLLNTVSPGFLSLILSLFLFIAGATLLGIGVWGNLAAPAARAMVRDQPDQQA